MDPASSKLRSAVVAAGILGLLVLADNRGGRPAHADPPAPKARAVAILIDHTCVDAKDTRIPLDALKKVRALKVVFGHQSVGFDVVGGLRSLAQSQPERYALNVQPRIEAAWFARNAGFGEFFLGKNGDPAGKVDAFAQAVRGGFGEHVDVAMMKLCYADLTEASDPKAIFERWKSAYEALEKEYPKVRFVWWTAPLTIPPRLGDKRTQMNDLVRAYAKGAARLLLDIADIECHAPDGKASLHPGGAEKLFDDYARDQGGHLNTVGAERAARAVWWLLARVAGWEGPK